MEVNKELKFLCKFKRIGVGGEGGRGGGRDRVGAVRVDVIKELKFL